MLQYIENNTEECLVTPHEWGSVLFVAGAARSADIGDISSPQGKP